VQFQYDNVGRWAVHEGLSLSCDWIASCSIWGRWLALSDWACAVVRRRGWSGLVWINRVRSINHCATIDPST